MKRTVTLMMMAAALLATVLNSGCTSSGNEGKNGKTGKNIPKLEKINLTDTERGFVDHNNAFALQLFKAVADGDGAGKSFLLSPLSVTYALGMLNNGADGITREEINRLLGFGQGDAADINAFCHKLMTGAPKVDRSVKIKLANLVEVNQQYTLQPAFKQTVEQAYAALVENADFTKSATTKRINNWCSEQTNGMIPQIIEEINPVAVAYLFNAIYFKGEWRNKFNPAQTQNKTFTTSNGRQVEVPMMCRKGHYAYSSHQDYSVLSMPYGNEGYCMSVFLPNEGKTIAQMLTKLDGKKWKSLLNAQSLYDVDVEFPRFETQYRTTLSGVLKVLGAASMFNPSAARFTKFCNVETCVSEIFQKARIKVNEEGSEAAAITGGEFTTTALPDQQPPSAVFHANRSFVYVISETTTGSIYFIGVYNGDK